MQHDTPLELFIAALPFLAHAVGGVALVTDLNGCCLQAIDFKGERRTDFEGQVFDLCLEAADQGSPRGRIEDSEKCEFFAIPLGELVLAASNAERAERRTRLFDTLKETLPLIAEVAGGEAVLFDSGGRRLFTADPHSRGVREEGGKVLSEPCLEVMQSGCPSIGPSRTVSGATAVRIPIALSFGFGFNNAFSMRQREKLLDEVKKGRTAKYTWDDIVHSGPRLHHALELAHRAAENNASVLILGESGTGKELFAQAIHNGSARAGKPFVAINCAALPESLVESTFFGHADGAFTGARRGGQAGLFEQANGGTLLLDEISEAPLDLQAKLLRVLQEKEVRRVGGDKSISIDVRIIATCNRDLMRCMDEGTFRSDLFYRLNVIDIYIPPLRQGREDIPAVTHSVLERLARDDGIPVPEVDAEAMAYLTAYNLRGNVRELRNMMERTLSLNPGKLILPWHLPRRVLETNLDENMSSVPKDKRNTLTNRLVETEYSVLLETLERCQGNRKKAASELGISVTTLWRRLRKLKEGGGGS